MSIAPHPAPTIGSLVHVRGRDWVVLPSSDPDILQLRPLTGGDATGIFLPLEGRFVRPASFHPPDPAHAGDTLGGLLLTDAARLSIRNGATPFRSLGHISVTPRPYQFVPLIMALRLDRARLLIADDVGVGKTVEAGMIARELLDRGVAQRLTVLCPPHLCDQWQAELRDKFGIDAAIIQPSTIGRLERDLPRQDVSIYQHYRNLIISIDYAKTERNRGAFLSNAADLIIVDEAHTAARPPSHGAATQHQRYELLRRLAADPNRHLVLVTATPHSGVEESFRSLLGLLDPAFDTEQPLDRRQLLPHVVQRRRRDLRDWLGEVTPFPERRSEERPYSLSPEYHRLFGDILDYCRESIVSAAGAGHQQRVRHWAAIALLRCVLSSPAAAEAVLTERARREGIEDDELFQTIGAIDAAYRPQVLDPIEDGDSGDYAPAAPLQDAEPGLTDSERRRLTAFMRRSRELAGPDRDGKLQEAERVLRDLLRDGFHPIVFCRFIATAHYLKAWLPKLLAKEFPNLRVDAVTGEIGDEERRERAAGLAQHSPRILVATDCLSEGINLQESFDAVVHFDLPWNPNRLEQREGRVDRFGQTRSEVRTTVLYGADNPIDQVVLDVLIRKAREIRRQLGISVPVPVDTDGVVQAVVDSVLLHRGSARQMQLGLGTPEVSQLHTEWERAADKARDDRAYFAQHGIQPDEVARELEAVDPVLGDAVTVERFLRNAAQRLGGELRPVHTPVRHRTPDRNGGEAHEQISLGGPLSAPNARDEARVFDLRPGPEMLPVLRETDGLRAILERHEDVRICFDAPGDGGAITVGRTHPLVARYCDVVLGKALDLDGDPSFARCGAMVTDSVSFRTGIALLRLRYTLYEDESRGTRNDGDAGRRGTASRPRPTESPSAGPDFGSDGSRGDASRSRPTGARHEGTALGSDGAGGRSHQEFAEEVVLVAFRRQEGKAAWVQPWSTARDLLNTAQPVANLDPAERAEHVRWALDLLADPATFEPVVDWRVSELAASNRRLRTLIGAQTLRIDPHTPPDILGLYVLIPGTVR